MTPARFLALGDSYTIGEGVTAGEAWPAQLVRALRARGVGISDAEVIARTGWRTWHLEQGIVQRAPVGPFRLVTLLIGVNDQYNGVLSGVYRTAFLQVLARAVALAGGESSRVIVVSIPDWGVTPFGSGRNAARMASEIDTYNRINREAASTAGAHYAEITDLTRADPGAVTDDGLHPNSAMYAQWAERIRPAAEEILMQRPSV